MSGEVSLTRHVSSDEPRVLVVDGSRVVRQLIERVLKTELPNAVVIGCGSGAEARAQLDAGVVDLMTTALRLPDMDGVELARYAREESGQAYIPVVVVSGDVQERLVARTLSAHVTDYFDKSLGFDALAAFIRGYVRPAGQISADVLYVEDSRVVALATRRMMERCGFVVSHVVSVEAALDMLEAVQIRDPKRVFDLYPHEVSGGMGQRAMIAMMLIAGPELLIADEPTSALDADARESFLRLLFDECRDAGTSLLFVSHDQSLAPLFDRSLSLLDLNRAARPLEA